MLKHSGKHYTCIIAPVSLIAEVLKTLFLAFSAF